MSQTQHRIKDNKFILLISKIFKINFSCAEIHVNLGHGLVRLEISEIIERQSCCFSLTNYELPRRTKIDPKAATSLAWSEGEG